MIALALALAAAEPSLLLTRPTTGKAHEMIELKPAAGHHFNPEAPQKCGSARADTVTPRRFRCQLRRSGTVEVVASVCDDAKTFCRQERFEIKVEGALPEAARAKVAPKPHTGPAGFLVNQPGKAMTLARRFQQPLFVHFYGIWCPPCNMLEEGVYPTEEFAKASDGFIKLALDADAELSWDWKARFKIGGYPTLLVLDDDGRELDRAVGYRSPAVLAEFLARARKREEPVEAAAAALEGAAPDAEGARRERVARWRYERQEHDASISAAAAAPAATRWRLLAQKDASVKADDAAATLAALRELTTRLSDDPEFVGWAADLAERDKEAGAALAETVKTSAAQWAADPAAAYHGLVPGDLRAMEASYLETIGRDAKAAWSAAADAYGADAKASRLALARGANLERAYCLHKASRTDEARALYEQLVSAYPEEFTFHFGYARLLHDVGESAAAIMHAKKARASGYGDNWLRAVGLEAKILKVMGLPKEAAELLDSSLAEAAAPKSAAVRTHRYLAELRKLRAELP